MIENVLWGLKMVAEVDKAEEYNSVDEESLRDVSWK